MMIHLKFALLATFIVGSLLGMAMPNMNALAVGIFALGLSILIAIGAAVSERLREQRVAHSTL